MKTTKEMIEVMQAYLRGELIEFVDTFDNESEWKIVRQPLWDWYHNDYRVKPKKKYVPFETAEEFLAAQKLRNTDIVIYNGEEHYSYANYLLVYLVNKTNEAIMHSITFYGLLRDCTFKDSTPCGKEVIDE